MKNLSFLAFSISAFSLSYGCKTRNFNNTGSNVKQNNTAISNTLDVNDVSFLFPLPKTPEEMGGLLKVSQAGGDGKSLLPEEIFNQIKTKSTKLGLKFDSFRTQGGQIPIVASNYKAWRVIGFRFDPCANSTNHSTLSKKADLASCIFEMRLIAQPLQAAPSTTFIEQEGRGRRTQGPDTFATEDFSMHLIYAIPKDKQGETLAALAQDLRNIKSTASVLTSGLPLGIHPVMAQEGLGASGIYAKKIRIMILKYMGGTKLTSVAVSGLKGEDKSWGFAAFPVNASTQAVSEAITIPEILESTTSGKFMTSLNGCCTLSPHLSLPKPSMDDFLMLFRSTSDFINPDEFTEFGKENETELRSGVTLAAQLENPQERSQFQNNCNSCHLATPFRIKTGLALATDANTFNRFQAPKGTTASVDGQSVNSHFWNIRNFGYNGHQAGASQRTANESAAVADLVSRITP